MKKITYMLLIILLLIPNFVNAADLQYAKDGWDKVGEIEAQVIKEKFNLASVKQEDIHLNGDFVLGTNKIYQDEDFASGGAFDNERNTTRDFTYTFLNRAAPYIAYNKSLTPNVDHRIDGSIVLVFRDTIILQDGSKCDLEMTVDNILLRGSIQNTKPILLLHDSKSTLSIAAEYASQEAAASELDSSHKYAGHPVGANYDLSFRVLKGGQVISKNMGISFKDIDTSDNFNEFKYLDTAGKPFPFVEAIIFLNGITDTVHLTSDSTLHVTSPEGIGNNTMYSAGEVDTGINEKSGLITLANSSNFKFRWTGSDCVTSIDFITTFEIITSTSGQYKDHGSITESIRDILWKSSKTIEMKPDNGYAIDKITIDDVVINYKSLPLQNNKRTYTKNNVTYTFTETNGTVTYTFSSITKDHKIDVSFIPDDGNGKYIFHYDGNGGTGHMDDTIAQFDVKGNISKNTFTKEGYMFVGWKAYYKDNNGNLAELKDDNGKVITFKDQEEYLNLYGKNHEEVTLVAQWINNPKTGTISTIISVLMILIVSVTVFLIYSKRKNLLNNNL